MKAHLVSAWVCAAACSATLVSRADERKDPRAIIDRAIVEAGGREALARYKKPFRQELKIKNLRGNGPVNDSKTRIVTWLPDKLRAETDQTINGQAITLGFVFNGKQGSGRGATGGLGQLKYNHRTLGAAEIEGHRKQLYAQWVATLLPLDDEAFELSALGESMLDGRPALGVKVLHAERPEVRLYFDREAMTLVKLAWQANETTQVERLFDDFAELDGLVYPRKTLFYVNGAAGAESQLTKFEFLDTVDEGTFEAF